MTGTSDLHNDIPSPISSGQGPGRLVRQARENAKLSIEDLAAQIKLARFTLDAIERDDFAQLNEPVYVRGYYRKLSKVLPVSEAELIAAYERSAGPKAPPHPSKLILAGGPELGSGRRVSLKLAIAIIVLGLLVGALAFWGKNRNAGTSVQAPETTGAIETPVTPVTEPETQRAVPPAETPAVTPSTSPEASSSMAPATTKPPAVAAAAPSTAVATTPAAAAAASVPSGTPGPLQLQFNGNSWTEVKDVTGKLLLSGLVESGSTQTLDGRPPFYLFLGNAPAVTITFNGQPVDLSKFRRGDNTARLSLP